MKPPIRPTRLIALLAIGAALLWLVLLQLRPELLYVHSPNNVFGEPDWSTYRFPGATIALSALWALATATVAVATRNRWMCLLAALAGLNHLAVVVVVMGLWLHRVLKLGVAFAPHLQATVLTVLSHGAVAAFVVFVAATLVLRRRAEWTRNLALALSATAASAVCAICGPAVWVHGNWRLDLPVFTVVGDFFWLMQFPVQGTAMLGIALLGASRASVQSPASNAHGLARMAT